MGQIERMYMPLECRPEKPEKLSLAERGNALLKSRSARTVAQLVAILGTLGVFAYVGETNRADKVEARRNFQERQERERKDAATIAQDGHQQKNGEPHWPSVDSSPMFPEQILSKN
jgi:hypothetical protein